MNWIQAAANCDQHNLPFVLITVMQTKGSTPRDCDAKMVITPNSSFDSVGGGQLEFAAIKTAHRLLDENKACSLTENYNLAKDLEQCCGGKVSLLFECFPARQFNITLIGAGHVGSAVIRLLGELPCQVRWIDARENCFPKRLPANVQAIKLDTAEQAIDDCPANSWYLVMSHSHVLDQQLVEAILSRKDVQYCGLIGSKSKAAAFHGRLKRKGFSDQELAVLSSPIGLPGLKGKQPMEIAISVIAQLLQLKQQPAENR